MDGSQRWRILRLHVEDGIAALPDLECVDLGLESSRVDQ